MKKYGILISGGKLIALAAYITSILLLVAGPRMAFAQELAKNKNITVQFSDGEKLDAALRKVEKISGIIIAFDPEAVGAMMVNARNFTNATLSNVLDHLLKRHGLTYNTQSGSIYIFKAPTGSAPPKPHEPARITGKVIDASSGEPMQGASIRINNRGTVTDADGNFSLNLTPGKYDAEFSLVGYTMKKVTGISVDNGQTIMLEIPMEKAAGTLSAVTVKVNRLRTVSIKNSNERSLVQEIRASPGVITGISNQQIERTLDRNAAQVVKRVPGVSLLDRFIVIRGLSPRYSIVQINGLLAPSSETDQRAFSFDLLPAGVIDQVTVYKSPAPELPSGFAGGVVKITTKRSNVARRLRLGISTQYQPGASFTDHQSYGSGSSKDWLASGAGDRKWKEPLLYDMKAKFPKFDLYPEENVQLAQAAKYSNLAGRYHNLDKRADLEYYDSWKIGKMRLNNLSAVNYSNVRDFNQLDYQYRIYHRKDADGNIVATTPELQFTDSIYTASVRVSAMENLHLRISEHHQLSFDNLFSKTGRDQVFNRDGIDQDQAGQREKNFQFEYRQRIYYQGQLGGGHQFGKLHAEWKAGYSFIEEKVPDVERYYFTTQDSSSWNLGITRSTGDAFNRTFTENTKEEGYLSTVDLTYPVTDHLKLLGGGLYQRIDRSFSLFGFNYTATNNTRPELGFVSHPSPWYAMGSLYGPDKFRTDGTGYALTRFDPAQFASYLFRDKISAGYFAIDYQLLRQKLTIHTGLRYEKNTRHFFNADGTPKISPEGTRPLAAMNNTFWLPSISATFNVNDKYAVRASYGKTIDRPDYREQTFFRYYNYSTQNNVQGNPYLRTASIHNYDLRLEHYPQPGEFIALGVFYKHFTDAIEMFDNTGDGWMGSEMSYDNTKSARLYGVEAEFRRSLSFVPFLKNFSVIANAAFTKSKVNFSDSTWNGIIYNVGLRNPGRPMVGTSPFIVNAGIFYDRTKSGTQVSAMYNVIGPRLLQASGINNPDRYELQRHVIDLVFAQRINRWLAVKGGIQDLLNQEIRLSRDEDLSGDFNPGVPKIVEKRSANGELLFSDYIESRFRPGSYFSLGINVTL